MLKLLQKKGVRNFITIILFVATIVAVRYYIQRSAISGQAPQFTGIMLNGNKVSLEQYRGEPVLLHFWASWCRICRLEEGTIASLAEDLPVLTVATQSGDADDVQEYLNKQELKIPVMLDEDGTLASLYGARGVPASFILDAGGKVRFVEFGYTTELGFRMRLWLAGLLS